MEAIGSEVGIKMRSAIKAKLMELGCYVDDELPDYVMVMVANKRTRSQMEDDLQLFLSNNTEAFVCWLHQVLQKLQEVTINTKLVIPAEINKKGKTKRSPLLGKKEHKDKDKSSRDRSKGREKLKLKKSKKDKTKKSEDEGPRPNIPRLLMNLEKESSPSITDIFAGQILKSHRILNKAVAHSPEICDKKETTFNLEEKTKRKLIRNRFPIIDPVSVSQMTENVASNPIINENIDSLDVTALSENKKNDIIEDAIIEPVKKETENKRNDLNDIDSESEDFINLGTEADDLISVGLDDDNLIKNKEKTRAYTPPLTITTSASTIINKPANTVINSIVSNIRQPIKSPEDVLPQIELILPKRPLRDRLGVREDTNKSTTRVNYASTPQVSSKISVCNSNKKEEDNNFKRNGPKSVICSGNQEKSSIKSRLLLKDKNDDNNSKTSSKRIGSRIISMDSNKNNSSSMSVASVVRALPRPPNPHGITAAPQLLLRAMADAHKSLLSMPPKVDSDRNLKRKEIILPSRRNIKPQKIIIEVPTDNIPSGKFENHDSNSDFEIDMDTESLGEFENDRDAQPASNSSTVEYVPEPLKNKSENPKGFAYIPTHINSSNKSNTNVESAQKISNDDNANRNNVSQKIPQFVVTLDGLDPNVFLEKKLEMMESQDLNHDNKSVSSNSSNCESKEIKKSIEKDDNGVSSTKIDNVTEENASGIANTNNEIEKKSVGDIKNNSADSNNTDPEAQNINIKTNNGNSSEKISITMECTNTNPSRKRKASPIVFNKDDKKLLKTKIKIDSGSGKKYDSLPSLPPDKHRASVTALPARERCRFYPECRLGTACEFYHSTTSPAIKQNSICRAFPACTFGDKCVYTHPPCKFNSVCVRKDCPYSHNEKIKTKSAQVAPLPPSIASHVVPASNYKTVSSLALPPICKYHPNCSNSSCHWYHPKPCRFGKFCLNKVECNFYHHNISSLKWKSSHQA